ncbi:MAG: four helix bundle protein [Gemmatimonadales bacterium]
MATHEQPKAWQLCHELALAIHAETDHWPKGEPFGLTSQAPRAAHSAGANIAEGWAKSGSRELGRYLNITLGSLGELSYTLRPARDRGVLNEARWSALDDLRGTAGAVVWKFYKSVHARHR